MLGCVVLATACVRVLPIIGPTKMKGAALPQEGSRRPSREGAGKTGCARHPRSRVQRQRERRTRAYRFRGSSPAFPAQWFYGLFRALPGDRLYLPPFAREKRWLLTNLTPASRRQDHTTS